MKLSNFFGKQVYSLYEGIAMGTISGVTLNQTNTKIKSFVIFDQDENEHELPILNIKALSDNVIIANKEKLSYYLNSNNSSPIHKTIIDDTAKYRGEIIDAEINEKGIIDCFITNNNESLKPNHLYHRKDFIFYSEKKLSMAKYRPKNTDILETKIKVRILEETNNKFIPKKINYNPISIIGKTAKNDLLGINNEIIIKANQQITEKVIEIATQHNRLNQLFYITI